MSERFHTRLKRLREQAGLSASEVAKLIDVAQSTYSDWENGKGLRLPPLQKLSQVLAIAVTELVLGDKPEVDSLLEDLKSVEEKVREIRTKLGSVS